VSLDLHSDEEIIFQGHPSWRALIAFYAKGVAGAILFGLVVWLVSGLFDTDRVGTAVLLGLIWLAIVLLVGFIMRWATVYTVTTRRLHIKRGIIARNVQETRLERVQNVNYQQSVLQRLLQVGDVDFDTAGTDDSDFVFAGLAQPEHVVRQVDRATGIASAGPSGLGQPAP
jgi:uncharacterized membrane protein YdbT with pleckstrin-like domain